MLCSDYILVSLRCAARSIERERDRQTPGGLQTRCLTDEPRSHEHAHDTRLGKASKLLSIDPKSRAQSNRSGATPNANPGTPGTQQMPTTTTATTTVTDDHDLDGPLILSLNHMTTHPPQQPRSLSWSLISILLCGPLPPAMPGTPEGYVDISLLYLRISRTMSKKALSTFMRDFAEVSMNLQPNCRATVSPSVRILSEPP